MKKILIIIILTFFSVAVSQGKMILNNGKEIILSDRINFTNYDPNSYFIMINSNRYLKSKIALLRLQNGKVLFRSGLTISEYNSLPIIDKAKADKRTSSKKFKNINQTLLDGLNEEQKQIYLIAYDSTISSPVKFFCISGGACSIVTITILLANPALFLPRF